MGQGKLIVLEGLDGSGKSTQLELLRERFYQAGLNVRHIKLPDYSSPACAPVKMYLGGELGDNPSDVNAFAASSFYAVDRFVSYQTKWKKDYKDGAFLLADRYSSSNAYHQMVKLPRCEWDDFLAWLDDYEHNKLGLPRPDLVIYLDMPIAVSQALLLERKLLDIHEKDIDYLTKCRDAAKYAAKKWSWCVIFCGKQGHALPIDLIQENIWAAVCEALEIIC
ncbi:MAG: thymidylate kinase [Oscillospiraceae bacterium]|jgi:dTMP kinase|nr:thymidylate kinase [Oscillospiraceae bacterium]